MELASLEVLSNIDFWQGFAVIMKAVTYGASFVAAGGVIFIAVFFRQMTEKQNRSIWRFVVFNALFGIVVSVLRIAVMNGLLTGEASSMLDAEMTGMLIGSSEGVGTMVRLLGLTMIVIFNPKKTAYLKLNLKIFFCVVGALMVATSFVWVGHASEVQIPLAPARSPQFLLSVHLLAVTFWIGALWPLHHLTYGDDLNRIAAIMHRFGKIAAMVVGLLVVAGAVLLWTLVGKVNELWTSAYGQLVISKLLLVGLLLMLAALNKLRLTPRLLAGDRSAVAKIRTSIKAEMTLASLILFITAVFTTVIGPVSLG